MNTNIPNIAFNNAIELRETPQTSDEVFSGRLIRVTLDKVLLPNNESACREVVHHRGAVAAVPIDEGDIVYLVKQWRHAASRALLEIPAGTLNIAEQPEECVRRELAEEIGRVPELLHHLTSMYVAPGYATEIIHIYLAREFRIESRPQDEDEMVQVVPMHLDEAIKACCEGYICDAKSITGLLLARVLLSVEGA